MIFLKLFYVFFKVGLFSFGGAYSFVPLIEREVVVNYGWLTKKEFLDITGFTQIFPGAISIKYASYIGNKQAGLLGVVVANIGHLLPPVLLVIFASKLYNHYKDIPRLKGAFNMVRVAAFSLIIAVAFQLIGFKNLTSVKPVLFAFIFLTVFVVTRIHPAWIILIAGIAGFI
ncbi:MAG: chromate transporter, partial [Elusimicrobiota bacterium]|nr:chromate transporter [Elusimicrobiota bacterium]